MATRPVRSNDGYDVRSKDVCWDDVCGGMGCAKMMAATMRATTMQRRMQGCGAQIHALAGTMMCKGAAR
eukprot:11026662-Alexandrium_andersonii.AAC.1